MGIFIMLLFWVGIAIATGKIAEGKGRDRAAWSMIGFFGGLIALLVAACMSDKSLDAGSVS
jgi:hypothetical protein